MSGRILILGMGNPILSDDGVGIKIVQEIARRTHRKNVDVKETNAAGFSIIDEVMGYRRVIIVDAVKTKNGEPGSIYRFSPDDFKSTIHLSSPHTINFATAMTLAEKYGYELPESIEIYGIEIQDSTSFGEDCTPRVKEAANRVVDEILKELDVSDKREEV